MISDADIAWAAGLFEGEGTFDLGRVSKDRHTGDRVYARASLGTTDEDVLLRFQAIVGVGSVNKARQMMRSGKKMWYWKAATRDDVEHVAELFRPWLGTRRLARMTEVLSTGHKIMECKCDHCYRKFTPQRLHRLNLPFYCSTRCRDKDRQFVRATLASAGMEN